MAFIFILALLLFGPKKLPELGRTIGKAMTEFRRAQSELKATFDREMANIERETGVKELAATNYAQDSYSHDYSSYDSSYYDGYDHSATSTTTAGASAIEGAGATTTLQIEGAAGSIANGHLDETHDYHASAPAQGASEHTEHASLAGASAPLESAEKPANS
jgi:TatA/E family protein of Tat protein translocase